MPWNGTGVPIRTDGVRTGPTVWDDAFNSGVRIRADHQDVHDQDLADMVASCVNRDGENAARANLPMGSFKFTGLGNGSARSDSLTLGQAQDDPFTWCGTAGGTGGAITLSPTPAIGSYVDGLKVRWVVSANNAGAATANVSAKGVIAIEKGVGNALTGGEMQAGDVLEAVYVSTTPSLVLIGRYAPQLARGFQRGQTLALDTDADHDVEISAGEVCSDDGLGNIILGSAITKRIDASWSLGDNAGGLDTGSVGNNSWYSVMAIARPDTGVADALFTLTPASPTMPANYTLKRHRGWVLTNGSANIVAFFQRADRFQWAVPRLDSTSVPTGSDGGTTYSLSVPTGAFFEALVSVNGVETNTDTTSHIWLFDPAVVDTGLVPGGTNGPSSLSFTRDDVDAVSAGQLRIGTNASGQIKGKSNNSPNNFRLWTEGWIDERL